MAQPYVGEVRMFGGNFAPAGWMFCEGQLLAISEYETLFMLIGTTYGGDGQSTFALPDLRGRIPIHFGNGFILAETGGAEEITLTINQIPAHSHPLLASSSPGTSSTPVMRSKAGLDCMMMPLASVSIMGSLLLFRIASMRSLIRLNSAVRFNTCNSTSSMCRPKASLRRRFSIA